MMEKFLLESEEDWGELAQDKSGYGAWREQSPPKVYPCIAIGRFDDYFGAYFYEFAYLDEFPIAELMREYLSYGSLDGAPIRQQLREQLKKQLGVAIYEL